MVVNSVFSRRYRRWGAIYCAYPPIANVRTRLLSQDHFWFQLLGQSLHKGQVKQPTTAEKPTNLLCTKQANNTDCNMAVWNRAGAYQTVAKPLLSAVVLKDCSIPSGGGAAASCPKEKREGGGFGGKIWKAPNRAAGYVTISTFRNFKQRTTWNAPIQSPYEH